MTSILLLVCICCLYGRSTICQFDLQFTAEVWLNIHTILIKSLLSRLIIQQLCDYCFFIMWSLLGPYSNNTVMSVSLPLVLGKYQRPQSAAFVLVSGFERRNIWSIRSVILWEYLNPVKILLSVGLFQVVSILIGVCTVAAVEVPVPERYLRPRDYNPHPLQTLLASPLDLGLVLQRNPYQYLTRTEDRDRQPVQFPDAPAPTAPKPIKSRTPGYITVCNPHPLTNCI